MDHGTPEPSASDGFLAPEEHPFLQELDPKQWTYSGTEAVVTLVRRWSDSSEDTLIVLSPDIAYVRRDDGHGRKVMDERGAAVEMARLIHHLPAPGTPDAPIDEMPDPAIEPMK